MKRGRALCFTCIVASGVLASPLRGQEYAVDVLDHHDPRWVDASWVDDLGFAALNAVVSGIMGGVTAVLREQGSFADGFVQGSLGGAVVYGGKRLSAARFDGAGALGRVVTSAGSSLIDEAGSGTAPRRIVVPFGIVRFYYDRDAGTVHVRPDLVATYWSLYGIGNPSLRFDLGRTLSAGAAVFVTHGAALDHANGLMVGGTIVLDASSGAPMGDVFAHERVHVAQWDHTYMGGGQGIEKWAGRRLGLGGLLARVDVPLSPMSFFAPLGNRNSNPFEVEADYLEARTRWK